MVMEKIVERYIQLVKTEHFAEYEKDFACKIQAGLLASYASGFDEPSMVQVIERIVNNLKKLSESINGIEISTKSIFIHGNKSRVEFEYYERKVMRELGDLIFILSVIYNGRKYFEKVTISQFKKDIDGLRWDLSNKEQIYLLSRFPQFRGARGSIIPMREFNLPNYSGCLGSFNLLFRPGDFVFISAPILESFMGNRRSINIMNIFKFLEPPCYYLAYSRYYVEELIYFWRKLLMFKVPIPFLPFCSMGGILGFSYSAHNVHEFVDKYLRGCVGELIYSDIGIYNKPVLDFLHELLSAIRIKGVKEGETELIDFVDEFFGYQYSSGEGGVGERVWNLIMKAEVLVLFIL